MYDQLYGFRSRGYSSLISQRCATSKVSLGSTVMYIADDSALKQRVADARCFALCACDVFSPRVAKPTMKSMVVIKQRARDPSEDLASDVLLREFEERPRNLVRCSHVILSAWHRVTA